jgi:hypothetical protein
MALHPQTQKIIENKTQNLNTILIQKMPTKKVGRMPNKRHNEVDSRFA